jgi:uncharacterized protein
MQGPNGAGPGLSSVSSALVARYHRPDYVLIETEALAYRRLGARVARRLLEDVVPVLEIVWVNAELHAAAVTAHLRALRRRSSLVDQVSFELMRRRDISVAVALDRDFAREGFEVLPPA